MRPAQTSTVFVIVALALALALGLAVGQVGVLAVVALVGLAIAAGAFVDLRITLLAIVPAMVLLPELPLSVPVRTEDVLMMPLAGAWLARLALGYERWPSTPLNAPLFSLIVVELAAMLWGAFRGTAGFSVQLYSSGFFFLKTVEVTLLYFIVVSTIRTKQDVRLFATVFCAAAAALGVWGMVESSVRGVGQAIVGPTGHGGYSLLGLTFVVLLATLASLFLTQRSRPVRALLVLAALPVAYSLVFTLSRQSYVGAVAAAAVLVWVSDRRLIIPAVALGLALPLLVPDIVQERALSIVAAVPDPISGVSAYATRLHALQLRIPEVIGGSLLFGFGPASLPPGFLDNQYLLTFYYTGFIGLGVFLWLLWRAATTAYRSFRDLQGGLKGLGLAWFSATIGLTLAGLAGSPFVAVRVREVYWFLAAMAVAATLLPRPTEEPAERVEAAEEARV